MSTYFTLIRSDRKTVSVCVKPDLSVVVRAPRRLPVHEIERFIDKHNGWIEKQKNRFKEQTFQQIAPTEDEVRALKERAYSHLTQRVPHFAAIMGVHPEGVTITSARTRWGSCSGKNRLCFSYRLMLLPDELIDYIVVHELSHIREKNHSKRFYNEVARYMPDYKERRTRLKAFHTM